MVISDQDKLDFKDGINCKLCRKELGDNRVSEHNHLTSQYRRALYSFCNLKFTVRKRYSKF